MSKHYSDPSRASDPHALPDIEVFYYDGTDAMEYGDSDELCPPGWYWWTCFPGCLPDSGPMGPFDTEAEAITDAQTVWPLVLYQGE